MHYGLIKGTLIATQKVPDLSGIILKVLVPCNANHEAVGDALIAVDPIGTRDGDLVIWVGKREASLAIPGAPLVNSYPVDAAVTGIVDDIG